MEGKPSRSVPRGLGGSNPAWLLGGRTAKEMVSVEDAIEDSEIPF